MAYTENDENEMRLRNRRWDFLPLAICLPIGHKSYLWIEAKIIIFRTPTHILSGVISLCESSSRRTLREINSRLSVCEFVTSLCCAVMCLLVLRFSGRMIKGN